MFWRHPKNGERKAVRVRSRCCSYIRHKYAYIRSIRQTRRDEDGRLEYASVVWLLGQQTGRATKQRSPVAHRLAPTRHCNQVFLYTIECVCVCFGVHQSVRPGNPVRRIERTTQPFGRVRLYCRGIWDNESKHRQQRTLKYDGGLLNELDMMLQSNLFVVGLPVVLLLLLQLQLVVAAAMVFYIYTLYCNGTTIYLHSKMNRSTNAGQIIPNEWKVVQVQPPFIPSAIYWFAPNLTIESICPKIEAKDSVPLSTKNEGGNHKITTTKSGIVNGNGWWQTIVSAEWIDGLGAQQTTTNITHDDDSLHFTDKSNFIWHSFVKEQYGSNSFQAWC